jgi:hypothetical protein
MESMITSKDVVTNRQNIIECTGSDKENDYRDERQDYHLVMFLD